MCQTQTEAFLLYKSQVFCVNETNSAIYIPSMRCTAWVTFIWSFICLKRYEEWAYKYILCNIVMAKDCTFDLTQVMFHSDVGTFYHKGSLEITSPRTYLLSYYRIKSMYTFVSVMMSTSTNVSLAVKVSQLIAIITKVVT